MFNLVCCRVCDKLRCILCDFKVCLFDSFEWYLETDYLFFRNNVLDFYRLKFNFIFKNGVCIYVYKDVYKCMCIVECFWVYVYGYMCIGI